MATAAARASTACSPRPSSLAVAWTDSAWPTSAAATAAAKQFGGGLDRVWWWLGLTLQGRRVRRQLQRPRRLHRLHARRCQAVWWCTWLALTVSLHGQRALASAVAAGRASAARSLLPVASRLVHVVACTDAHAPQGRSCATGVSTSAAKGACCAVRACCVLCRAPLPHYSEGRGWRICRVCWRHSFRLQLGTAVSQCAVARVTVHRWSVRTAQPSRSRGRVSAVTHRVGSITLRGCRGTTRWLLRAWTVPALELAEMAAPLVCCIQRRELNQKQANKPLACCLVLLVCWVYNWRACMLPLCFSFAGSTTGGAVP